MTSQAQTVPSLRSEEDLSLAERVDNGTGHVVHLSCPMQEQVVVQVKFESQMENERIEIRKATIETKEKINPNIAYNCT